MRGLKHRQAVTASVTAAVKPIRAQVPGVLAGRLPWWKGSVVPWSQRLRCGAVREPRGGSEDHLHGRCMLYAGHDGDHALRSRHLIVRWSTRATG